VKYKFIDPRIQQDTMRWRSDSSPSAEITQSYS